MSNLIDRQAAIDALCSKCAIEKPETCPTIQNGESWCDEVYALLNVPSAQSEIIRCKDCKHQEKFWHGDKRRKDGGYYIYGCELAEGYSHVCLDDDFCSRAERRTDG